MLSTSVAIINPASIGGGQYTFDLYFSDSARAKFLRAGDYVEDNVGNRYSIDTWSGSPSDFVSGSSVTTTYVDTDTLPAVSTGYDSTVVTPDQIDVRPQMRTQGIVGNISLYSGQDYEYQLQASWNDSVEENKAQVGDSILDASGKEFEISYLDGSKFATFFRMKEVEKEGIAPISGDASLYRPTVNNSFYQGNALSDPARTNIFNRDKFLIDVQLASDTALESTLDNTSGSSIAAEVPVCSVSGDMELIDVSDEAKIFALAGITKAAVNNGAKGTIVTAGLLKNVSITGNVDDPVFISKSGGLTTTKPSLGVAGFVAGDFVVQVGVLLENQSNPANKDLKINFEMRGQI